MTPISWINAVVGKPWVDRAGGPDAFDCWGLVVDSYRRIDGVEIEPVAGYDAGEPIETAGASEQSSGRWVELTGPKHGAVFCCYSPAGNMEHVGRILLAVGAGLLCLHARGKDGKGAVAADPVRLIQRAYHSVKYFERVA